MRPLRALLAILALGALLIGSSYASVFFSHKPKQSIGPSTARYPARKLAKWMGFLPRATR